MYFNKKNFVIYKNCYNLSISTYSSSSPSLDELSTFTLSIRRKKIFETFKTESLTLLCMGGGKSPLLVFS